MQPTSILGGTRAKSLQSRVISKTQFGAPARISHQAIRQSNSEGNLLLCPSVGTPTSVEIVRKPLPIAIIIDPMPKRLTCVGPGAIIVIPNVDSS